MISDARRMHGGFARTVDLCIIGGGAAGIALAQSFAGSRFTVCLVESGGLAYEEATQALYTGVSVGQPVDLRDGRVRTFGGSTAHWGGRCAELSAAEVAHRPWVPDSGWPMTLESLRPYYDAARAVCGFTAPWGTNEDVMRLLRLPGPADVTSAACMQVWRFAPSEGGLFRNFGTAYYDDIRRAPNLELLLHANATTFHTDDRAGHVDAITVQTLSGIRGTVSARYFALCCSGIDNARLLLTGSEAAPQGLGNEHGLVGRYFMEHPRGVAATLYTNDRLSTLQDIYNEFTGTDGITYQVGLALAERTQREFGLLNCSAVLEYHGDPEAGTTAAREIWRDLRDGHWPRDAGTEVWRAVRDLHALEFNVRRRLFGRPPLLPLQSIAVIVDIEQAPDPASRVSLGPRLDALGMREVVVDWRLSELERKTVHRFMIELGSDLARRGIGRLRLEPWLEAHDDAWKSELAETYHYLGTTRMAPDPAHGVVDTQCRVHSTDNLFVAGSSVFPTGGHVNPTLTIVALALRLSEHLRLRMAS